MSVPLPTCSVHVKHLWLKAGLHSDMIQCWNISEILTSFVNDLPSSSPKKRSEICFVKAGKSAPKSESKPSGIFHLATDWMIITDLKNGYVFPCQIARSALRPDIVLYSNSLKCVILLELTCPCEENMASWHSAKMTKYSGLINAIEWNGWCVDLFATEVGARGYCSRSITTSLKRLWFCNKLAFSTAKKLRQISMKSSFCILLARNYRVWSQVCLLSEAPSLPPAKIKFQTQYSACWKEEDQLQTCWLNK